VTTGAEGKKSRVLTACGRQGGCILGIIFGRCKIGCGYKMILRIECFYFIASLRNGRRRVTSDYADTSGIAEKHAADHD